MLASWKYAARHDQQDGDTPKLLGELVPLIYNRLKATT
jgi:hypothetical protein